MAGRTSCLRATSTSPWESTAPDGGPRPAVDPDVFSRLSHRTAGADWHKLPRVYSRALGCQSSTCSRCGRDLVMAPGVACPLSDNRPALARWGAARLQEPSGIAVPQWTVRDARGASWLREEAEAGGFGDIQGPWERLLKGLKASCDVSGRRSSARRWKSVRLHRRCSWPSAMACWPFGAAASGRLPAPDLRATLTGSGAWSAPGATRAILRAERLIRRALMRSSSRSLAPFCNGIPPSRVLHGARSRGNPEHAPLRR